MKLMYLGLMPLLLAAPLAHAQDVAVKANDLIAMRQAEMEMSAALAGLMKPVAQAKGDPASLKDAAAALAAWAPTITSQFPPGTETGHETKARPEIWSDRAGFEKAAADFTKAAQGLAEAAKRDGATFAAAYQATGEACLGCHRPYRRR
jgi:cytochrome c556